MSVEFSVEPFIEGGVCYFIDSGGFFDMCGFVVVFVWFIHCNCVLDVLGVRVVYHSMSSSAMRKQMCRKAGFNSDGY